MELKGAGEDDATEQEIIEEASIALVREFLSRKGCKRCARILEEEIPRNPRSIGTRVDLARALHIAPLLRRNKASKTQYRTVIEIISWDLATSQKNRRQSTVSKSKRPSTASAKYYTEEVPEFEWEAEDTEVNPISGLRVADSLTKVRHKKPDPVGNRTKESKMRKDSAERKKRDSTDEGKRTEITEERKNSTGENIRRNSNERKKLDHTEEQRRDSTRGRKDSNEERRGNKFIGEQRKDSTGENRIRSSERRRTDFTGEQRRDSTRERRDSTEERKRRDSTGERRKDSRELSAGIRKDVTGEGKTDFNEERKNRESSAGIKKDVTGEGKSDFNEENKRRESIHGRRKQDIMIEDIDNVQEAAASKCVKWLAASPSNPSGSAESSISSDKKEGAGSARRLSKPKFKLSTKLPGMPLTFDTAVKLRGVVFGSSGVRGFTSEWIDQSFGFRECDDGVTNRLRFGIVQKHGGPCGLLAAVQACFLKHLLFGKVGNSGTEIRRARPSVLNVASSIRTKCLAEAIVEILWRAGNGRRAVVSFLSSKQSFTPTSGYKEDGITEFLLINTCQSLEDLHEVVYENIAQFENGQGSAVQLLYSAVLSRGFRDIVRDMDDPMNILMGAHSYCTQEMVNLLTIGRAVSNTFDDQMILDQGLVLHGVTRRADVGLLSLFEHFKSCIVGGNLKTPRYPIWIVCSESHFTVMFGLTRNLVDDEAGTPIFDLFYHDGLANLGEEIKLTVDTTKESPAQSTNDLVSPLEHCIRTKWPQCAINWNGSEPLL